MSQGIKNK